jgi:hypothetical protein
VLRIQSQLRVVVPGRLVGRIAFNPAGSPIRVAGDRSSSSSGCAQAVTSSHRVGACHSRIVSTLHETFTKPGRYTLTFSLNAVGRKMVARLAAARRAYDKQRPNSHEPPALGYGVGLTYVSGG